MLKTILPFLILLLSLKTFSQTYENNKAERTFAIEDLGKKNIRKVNQKKLEWRTKEIYGEYENGVALFGITGILKNDIVTKYFNPDDLKFIEQQYITKDSLWKESPGKYKVLGSSAIEKINRQSLKTHKMKSYYYSISNPLFSLDGQFMILKIDFYCGFMCSDQCIYLFQKPEKGQYWKEIAKWNCWSS